MLETQITFTSFEIELEIVELAYEKQALDKLFHLEWETDRLYGHSEYVDFEVLIGDARKTFKEVHFSPYQAIFQDAFLPKKTQNCGLGNGLILLKKWPQKIAFFPPIVLLRLFEKPF